MKFLDLRWQFEQIPEFSEKIINLIKKGTFILSEEVRNFEKEWAEYIGVKYCIGVNSGTDALALALKAIGIKGGDKVIVQANTFAATVYAIIQNQGIPVFVDIDYEYGCINLTDLKKTIKKESPKAIIVVHLYGQPCFASEITKIAKENDIFLIEDCAQAHGAKWKGKYAGTFGDISCFSFFPSKNLGAIGDAGAVCTNNPEYFEKIIMYRNLGAKVKNIHEAEWGGNSRLDAIQALVLSMKLKYLDKWNERRRKIASKYREYLKDLSVYMYKDHPDSYNVYHQFVVMVENRDKIINMLKERGIPTLIHYPIPVHQAKAFKKYADRELTVAEWISKRHFSLPMSPHLTDEEINFICGNLKEVLKHGKKPKPICS